MKLQFNSEGFFALQRELYQLSDDALKIESELIQHNFNHWINHHFELSEVQLKYLESMGQHIRLTLSFDTSFAIENRLPIRLNSTTDVRKITCEPVFSLPRAYHHIVNYAVCGTLQINIKTKNDD